MERRFAGARTEREWMTYERTRDDRLHEPAFWFDYEGVPCNDEPTVVAHRRN